MFVEKWQSWLAEVNNPLSRSWPLLFFGVFCAAFVSGGSSETSSVKLDKNLENDYSSNFELWYKYPFILICVAFSHLQWELAKKNLKFGQSFVVSAALPSEQFQMVDVVVY